MQKLPLKILRDYQNPTDPTRIDLALRAREIRQLLCDRYIRRGINPARKVSAALGAVSINDCDRNVTQRLVQVGLRVEERIESDTQDQHRESGFDLKDTRKFSPKFLKNAVHECTSSRRRGALGLLTRSRDARMLSSFSAASINDCDRNVTQRLVQVGLRVEERIESDTQDQHRESGFDLKDTRKFSPKFLKNAVHECTSSRRRGALGLLTRSRDARMLSSFSAASPASAIVKASRTNTGFQESSMGVPLTVWSTRAVKYQVPGNSAPQA